jgi:hypothetical protein
MTRLLETLFTEGLRAYAQLIDRNLPGLRSVLPLYKKLPVTAVVDYRRPAGVEQYDWGTLTYTFVSSGGEPAAEVHVDARERVFDHNPAARFLVLLGGKYIAAPGWHQTGLQSLLMPYDAPGFRSASQGSGASRYCAIRAFAYDIIRDELAKLSAGDLLAAIAG